MIRDKRLVHIDNNSYHKELELSHLEYVDHRGGWQGMVGCKASNTILHCVH